VRLVCAKVVDVSKIRKTTAKVSAIPGEFRES
jgi:hypothetical protein